jgi:NADH-quinone oxidoreductase subunit E
VTHNRYRVEEAGEPRKFPPEAMARIEKILKRYPTKQAALLPVLWVAQETWGWISKEAAEEVARLLELPPSHVDGVLTFYTMYNLRPVGKNLLQFCTSISCHLLGAGALLEHCRKRLGIDLEETTKDGNFTLVEVECIAGCDKAPSMMVNDKYYEPMDAAKLDALLTQLSREAGRG